MVADVMGAVESRLRGEHDVVNENWSIARAAAFEMGWF